MTRQEILENSKQYTLFTWTAQSGYDPICVEKVDGVYFWDMDGTRYTDISAQLVCVNLGFNNEAVKEAIKAQVDQFCYVAPRHTYEARAELGRLMIEELAPKNMGRVLFSLGGADANEYALRCAMFYSGRDKVMSKYQSYHGSTWGAGGLTGEAERAAPGAGNPGFIKFIAPHTYTYDIRFKTEAEATEHFLCQLEYQIKMEGVNRIAALFIETVPGSNGVYIYPEGYLRGVRELCTKYGILMVCDEVMSGFGRCGEWFACQAYGIEPDIITFAKGVNSGYAPLGGMIVSKEISAFFENHAIPAGLTYNAHALGVAAAIANIKEYRRLNIMEHVKTLGVFFKAELQKLQEKHPCLGDARCIGLFSALELVKNKETREPLLNENGGPILGRVVAELKKRHLTTVGHDNTFMFAPALTVTKEQLIDMLAGVDEVLSVLDTLVD